MKEQIRQMKTELKDLARQIKTLKPEYRQSQRDLSLFYNDQRKAKTIMHTMSFWASPIGKESTRLSSTKYSKEADLVKAKYAFRHKHIAYCLLRGRTIEQIESIGSRCKDKCYCCNKPDMKLVEKIMKEVQDKVSAEVVVTNV